MTSVSLSAAQNSATPVSPGDRYVTSTSAPNPLNVEMLQAMWDGTYPGFPTTISGQSVGYDVKNVRVLLQEVVPIPFLIAQLVQRVGEVP